MTGEKKKGAMAYWKKKPRRDHEYVYIYMYVYVVTLIKTNSTVDEQHLLAVWEDH